MIGHLDCSTGVSGDKFLGALLDAGESSGRFRSADLDALVRSLAPEARVVVERTTSRGIAARSVRVGSSESESHRHLADIEHLLDASALPAAAKERARSTFRRLASAEAEIHATGITSVHFHEVGALDSILDIVGVCAGMEALGIEQLVATPVAVGGGTVSAAHGLLPVPAPATAALLFGAPIVPGPHASELTTPTGAALLGSCVDSYGTCPPMTLKVAGYGAGTRDIGVPNVCRLLLGEPAEKPLAELSAQDVTVLETNVDHLSPEHVAFIAEVLLAQGAADVWTSPIVMKKGRSAAMLSVLVERAAADATAARVIELTGSLGVRRLDLERFVAVREIVEVPTPYGTVRVKSGAGRLRPEHDDIARIAREHGRTYGTVSKELEELAREFLADS